MYLYLNTSTKNFISLALIDKQGQILVYKKNKAEYKQAEKLLTEIDKIIGGNNHLSKLKGIVVVSGPGGFTSLRIGLATANALSWVLQIPIVGVKSKNSNLLVSQQEIKELDQKLINSGFNKIKKIKKFKQVLPKYGSEPHITLKK